MSIPQISVFLQSEPGHLSKVLNAFEEAKISVRGYSASDTGDYGVVRFILDDPEKGLELLKAMGGAVVLSDVLCIRLIDTPGELARVMSIMADEGINVVYSYSLISTYIVLKVDDIKEAEDILSRKPVELIELEALKREVEHA